MKIVIQAVREREHLVKDLLKLIPSAVPYYDEKHEGCLESRVAILEASPEGVLIVQDDVILLDWFLEEAGKSIIEDELTFFCAPTNTWLPDAYEQGFSYARSKHLLWGQAMWHPAWFCKGFPAWLPSVAHITAESEIVAKLPARMRLFHGGVRMDDMTMRAYLRSVNRWAYLTLPNLVNHRHVRSTLGHGRTLGGVSWVSYLFGKKYLRPWDKTAITEWSETRKYPKTAAGKRIFPKV